MALVATVSRIFECEDSMLYKHKPTLESGQDVRTLPTYTIPEAVESFRPPRGKAELNPFSRLPWSEIVAD